MKFRFVPLLPCLWMAASAVTAQEASKPPAEKVPAVVESPATAPAPQGEKESELPDYVRMAEDEQSTRMETGIGSFALPDGRIVDLVGVVHLGDKSYYQDLNRKLGTYDAVLFELVGDPSRIQRKADPDEEDGPTHPLRAFQQTMGRLLRLEFQLESIDYTRPNFVHADAGAEEFEKMQKERGESMMQLMLKSFQLSTDPDMSEQLKKAQQIGIGDLIMLFYSDKAAGRFKVIFGGVLAESERLLDQKLLGKNSALIQGRNDVALQKLEKVLRDPAMKRVCIFYGAGHMPGMEAALRGRWKAEQKSFTWLPAWTMPPPEKKAAGNRKEIVSPESPEARVDEKESSF